MIQATIHHTAFNSPFEQHGKRQVEVCCLPDRSPLEAIFAHYNSPYPEEGVVVETSKSGRCYSVSCGDVIETEGKFFFCAACGWDEITKAEFEAMLTAQKQSAVRWTFDFDGVRLLKAMRKVAA